MRSSVPTNASFSLPDWTANFPPAQNPTFPSAEDKMNLVLALAERNVREETGGPFGAAVFETDSGRLVAMGVNRVLHDHSSIAHAEMMALMLAQQALKSHRLNANQKAYTLATSAQPCSMCFGATVWAGIDHLLIGARRSDVQSITGFDEGPLPTAWIQALTSRGVQVQRDIMRTECCESLKSYHASGGNLY